MNGIFQILSSINSNCIVFKYYIKMLSNKNIIVTGVGKGLGFDLLNKIISYNGYVYGITRSRNDLKKFRKIKNCKVFVGNVNNTKLFYKILSNYLLKEDN